MTQVISVIDRSALEQDGARVDGPSAKIAGARPANGIVAFQRVAEAVEARVATRASRVTNVFLSQLPDGERLGGFVLGQVGHILWRTRDLLTQKNFGDPI